MTSDKIFYTTSILDDDGILWVVTGWYNRYAPYIGGKIETKIDTKLEVIAVEKETCNV